MSPLHARHYGLDPYRVGDPQSPLTALRRRLGGRFTIDPFGLDPQLCDLLTPAFSAVVRVEVEGGERVPATGPAVLVSNRGIGVGEPAALGVAVRELTGRRLRAVGAPPVPGGCGIWRRLGVVGSHPVDLAALLRGGHLVAVPLGPSGLRTDAGPPPLGLCAAMLGFTVFPVAVTAGGPLGLPVHPWRVRIGPHVALDGTYAPDDPLAAAELGEAVREAVRDLLRGGDPDEGRRVA